MSDDLIDLAHEARFTLGAMEVRPPTREVVVAGGSAVIEPRVMQVLIALARRRGQVVSRDDLIVACWGGRAVGEDAINRCIQAIRRLADTHGGFAVTTVVRVGYRLDEAHGAVGEASPRPIAPAPGLERRRLTALSCRLIPAAGRGIDPEEWHEISSRYRQAAEAAAIRFGGHVVRGGGDSLTAYFGYPLAREDAAERAVRSGLAMIEAMANLAGGTAAEVSARIGLHAGVVLVSHEEGDTAEMFGDAAEVAARAGSAAGAVVISGAVHELVAGLFVTEPCGALSLEGAGEPLLLYRAVSAGMAGGRGFAPREPTPFVGREDEARLLVNRWARVRDGEGQVALVVGEAGIGKTRLVQEFKTRIAGDPHLRIECRGVQLFANTPFHAVTQMLRQGLSLGAEDSPATGLATLERAVGAMAPGETVPLLADLLGLPDPASYPPLTMAPEQKRRRLLAALAQWIFSAPGPLLLIVEDLHWVDPSSMELLQTLVEQGATAPLMLLCTARPEARTPWPSRAHHAEITLGALGARPMRALVGGLLARAGLDDALVGAVVRRADGVPLFAEELSRLMLEAGDRGRGPEDAIPATLLDSLAARLDRLGEAKAVAQLGSVLGREFTYELLAAVSSTPEDELRDALARLADAELIYVRGAPPEARYQFKHALIQDAAYEALLKSQRRALHGAAAEILTARFGALAEGRPEVLARHWSEAGEDDKAIMAWTQAGAAADSRHAFIEAAEMYRRARSVLARLPESAARDQHELDLGLALVIALNNTVGVRAPETMALAARNHVLAERGGFVGATTGMRTMMFAQAMVAGDWPQVAARAEQMGDFARRVGPGAERVAGRFAYAMAHFTQFNSAYYRGDLPAAAAELELWHAFHLGGDFDQRQSTVLALCNGANTAWHIGRSDAARRWIVKARAWGQDNDNLYETLLAQALECLLLVNLRDPDAAEALGTQTVARCDELGFVQVAGWTKVAVGWARAQHGAASEGVALIREAIAQLDATGSRISMPFFLAQLGQAQARAGDVDGALASFEVSLSLNPLERIYRPYSLIARGELRARLGDDAGAEADFRTALDEAGVIGSRASELRAAVNLAGGLRARGEPGAARDLLTPVLAAVTEGFDTVDYRAAKALADQLAGVRAGPG